jgi:hypothetical protein
MSCPLKRRILSAPPIYGLLHLPFGRLFGFFYVNQKIAPPQA